MMSHDEMIAVIQAHKEGKPIQFKNEFGRWEDVENMTFDFNNIDYRIKPEPHCRPFKNAEEVMEAIKEHGDWVLPKGYVDARYQVTVNTACIIVVNEDMDSVVQYDYGEGGMLEYTFADGAPFGVKEEEI